MTEQEKMAAGLWFNPADKALAAQRQHAKALCVQMNQQGPLPFKAHQQQAGQLFGKLAAVISSPISFAIMAITLNWGRIFMRIIIALF